MMSNANLPNDNFQFSNCYSTTLIVSSLLRGEITDSGIAKQKKSRGTQGTGKALKDKDNALSVFTCFDLKTIGPQSNEFELQFYEVSSGLEIPKPQFCDQDSPFACTQACSHACTNDACTHAHAHKHIVVQSYLSLISLYIFYCAIFEFYFL